jgi:hypothetical protein
MMTVTSTFQRTSYRSQRKTKITESTRAIQTMGLMAVMTLTTCRARRLREPALARAWQVRKGKGTSSVLRR